MSRYLTVAAILAGLALAAPCSAQSLTFGGIDPTKIQNKPITVPTFVGKSMQVAPTTTTSTLLKYFPSINLPTGKPIIGSSPFPKPGALPGKNYLNSFQYRYGLPVK